MRTVELATAFFLLAMPAAHAADSKGAFITGGGVGATTCPDFLNAMATARQKGGATSPGGVTVLNGFAHYVLGFQTGFNSEADGVYDVFTSLGPSPAFQALYAVEAWCGQNPDRKFASGLLDLANRLRARKSP